MAQQVIVVGGGLGGLSAAHTVLQAGGNVCLLDKNAFCGGNSTKATSGINGTYTKSQQKLGIQDNVDIFFADTMRGGASKEDMAKVLTHESGAGVDWLMDSFGLDLSLVSRLGGHSQPRTHRGKEKFPGMTITYAQMEAYEDICEKTPDRAKLVNKADVKNLIYEDGVVKGVEYMKDGTMHKEHGLVILATGGYAADFEKDGLLSKYRPEFLDLPTTNGEHCTGDGIKMANKIGGKLIDMKWVQVHPTGLVHPDEPDLKVKFLAAEALRGCGALLLDRHGKRFANELGRRDYVTGRMWKSDGPFRLVMNGLASTEIAWHCKHYKSRGLMKSFASGEDVAKEIGCDPAVLAQTFKEYNELAVKMAAKKDPEEGPYDAYGGGKTYDSWGKKFFHNYPFEMKDNNWHIAIVTPVLHYSMGGIEVDKDAQILSDKGPIPNLYGAGEINGGIHGENRLGGSSLLDCVVFGRVAGRTAARQLMEQNLKFVKAKL